MKDKNGMEHDSKTGQFTSGGSTPAEHKRADEIIGKSDIESIEDIKKQEQKDYAEIKKEYEASVNENIVNYVKNVIKGEERNPLPLVDISQKEIRDLKNLTGINVTGFSRCLTPDSVRHIEKRHGENGLADSSMSNINDIARMEYVLKNYDEIKIGNKHTKSQKNSDNTPAQTVVYEKRINGMYYVAEALPITNKKQLIILTAYKKSPSK